MLSAPRGGIRLLGYPLQDNGFFLSKCCAKDLAVIVWERRWITPLRLGQGTDRLSIQRTVTELYGGLQFWWLRYGRVFLGVRIGDGS